MDSSRIFRNLYCNHSRMRTEKQLLEARYADGLLCIVVCCHSKEHRM